MNELALFAGAGGGILGSHLLGWRTVCAVEVEPYRRGVLLRRQRDGVLPLFPIWDDIRTFDGTEWYGVVDCITAGFPCQPFSVAGKRRGADDERNLWPETIRVIREVQPQYAFLENVPGLLGSGYFSTILGDLAASGYDAEWDVLSAAGCGAPHRRERLWILSHAVQGGSGGTMAKRKGPCARMEGNAEWHGEARDVADAIGSEIRKKQELISGCSDSTEPRYDGWWATEPTLGRAFDGLAAGMDLPRPHEP